MEYFERLASGIRRILHRPATQPEIKAFSAYLSLLLQWSRVHSLTAYRDPADIVDSLFLDSLLFLSFLPSRSCQVLDLGSGAGIPGIPLKIIEPSYRLTLIEARRRRASFLTAVVRELALQDVRVLMGRAESLLTGVPALEGNFDAVVTRAAGPLGLVTPLALRFLKPGGRFIASGPPVRKFSSRPGEPQAWQILVSPASGLPRQFVTVEKIT